MSGRTFKTTVDYCTACHEAGKHGHCAPLRCYCGHPECHAYASWKPRTKTAPVVKPTRNNANDRQAQSWADREEPTWLDR